MVILWSSAFIHVKDYYQVVMLSFITIMAGIGALYVRRRPRVRLEAIQSGGGQERY